LEFCKGAAETRTGKTDHALKIVTPPNDANADASLRDVVEMLGRAMSSPDPARAPKGPTVGQW